MVRNTSHYGQEYEIADSHAQGHDEGICAGEMESSGAIGRRVCRDQVKRGGGERGEHRCDADDAPVPRHRCQDFLHRWMMAPRGKLARLGKGGSNPKQEWDHGTADPERYTPTPRSHGLRAQAAN